MLEFRITDEIQEQDRREIRQSLREYNLANIEDKNPKDVGIYLEDAAGGKLAGLIGDTHGKWLTVEFLWVSEQLRGQRIGSAMLKQAEQIAKERGCSAVFLNTFEFQAPEFYRKYGYQQVFAMQGYPRTGTRYYFTKEL